MHVKVFRSCEREHARDWTIVGKRMISVNRRFSSASNRWNKEEEASSQAARNSAEPMRPDGKPVSGDDITKMRNDVREPERLG